MIVCIPGLSYFTGPQTLEALVDGLLDGVEGKSIVPVIIPHSFGVNQKTFVANFTKEPLSLPRRREGIQSCSVDLSAL